MSKNNRFPYLDAARGFGILLIILSHIWENENPVMVLMYSFHVQMFFIIGGILMAHTQIAQRSWSQILKARLRGLVIPYFFYEVVFLIIFGLRSGFDFSSQNGAWYDSLLMKPLNVPVWFLIIMFMAELFMILVLKLVKNRYAAILIFATMYLFSFTGTGTGDRETIAVLYRFLSAVGLMAMGHYGSHFVMEKDVPVAVLIPLALLDCVLALYNGKVGIYKLTFHNPVLFTICAVLGSFLVLFTLKKIRIPALELLGQHTIAILGLHIIALRVLQEIWGLNTDGYLGGIVALVIVATTMTIAGMILERIMPFAVGKKRNC